MTNIKRQGLSLLTALILVISLLALLPEGALKAHALSGSGTANDPFIVTTYDELQNLLSYKKADMIKLWLQNSSSEVHIKLGKDLEIEPDLHECGNTIDYPNRVYFDLSGHKITRKEFKSYNPSYYDYIIDHFIFNITDPSAMLVISDTVGGGSMECYMSYSDIESGRSSCDTYLIENKGTLIINSGSFYNTRSTKQNYDFDYTLYNDKNASAYIYGGDFHGSFYSYPGANTIICDGKFDLINGETTVYGGTVKNKGDYSDLSHFYENSCIYELEISCEKANDLISTVYAHYYDPIKYSLADIIYRDATVSLDGKIISREELVSKRSLYGKKLLITSPMVKTADISVTEPHAGETPTEPKVKSGNVIIAGWNIRDMTTNEIVSSTDKFVQYRPYRYEVSLTPKQGYIINPKPTVTMNGDLQTDVTQTANQIFMSYRMFYGMDPLPKVDSIYLGTVVPRDGAVPSAPWTSAGGFTIKKYEWYKGDRLLVSQKMSSTDKFTEGQQYTFYCEVYADEGYKFASDAPAYVNSERAQTVKYSDRIGVKYTFTALASNVLPMFTINIKQPKADELIDDTVLSASPTDQRVDVYNASNTKNKITWSSIPYMINIGTSKFTAGRTYKATFKLSQSYKFGDDNTGRLYINENTVVMIGGKQAAYKGKSGIYHTYEASFTIPTVTTISSIALTVTAPKAGETPDNSPVILTDGVITATVVWSKINSDESLTNLTDNEKFEAGCNYRLSIVLGCETSAYKLADEFTVTVNGKSAKALNLLGIGIVTADFEVPSGSKRQVGDVNGDGKISADDAIIVARYAAGYGDYKTRYSADIADMNRDGTVSADDAIIIARYSAGYGDYKTRYTYYV